MSLFTSIKSLLAVIPSISGRYFSTLPCVYLYRHSRGYV